MTVITGREFRANQSKYIGMAHKGERVILSSRSGYAELIPVSKQDTVLDSYLQSKTFRSVASKVRREYMEGKTVSCSTPEEIIAHLDAL